MRRSASIRLAELSQMTGIPVDELAEHETGVLPLPLSRVRSIAVALDRHPLDLFVRLICPVP